MKNLFILILTLNVAVIYTNNNFYCSAYCSSGCGGIGNTKCGTSCQSGGSSNTFIRTGMFIVYTCNLNGSTYGILY